MATLEELIAKETAMKIKTELIPEIKEEIIHLITKNLEKAVNQLKSNGIPTLINASQAARMVGVARGTWYDLVNDGNAPQPVPLSETLRRWRRDEVEDYIEKRSQARVTENAASS